MSYMCESFKKDLHSIFLELGGMLYIVFVYFRWGYSFLSNRYQFTWSCRLGHDAELFWSSLHVGFGEARKIWWTSTILCNSSTNRIEKTSWKLCLQVYFAIGYSFMYEYLHGFHLFLYFFTLSHPQILLSSSPAHIVLPIQLFFNLYAKCVIVLS